MQLNRGFLLTALLTLAVAGCGGDSDNAAAPTTSAENPRNATAQAASNRGGNNPPGQQGNRPGPPGQTNQNPGQSSGQAQPPGQSGANPGLGKRRGEETPRQTAAEQIVAMEASGQLPVLDRAGTVTGVDADRNGVRDDIDRYIGKLPDTPEQKRSLAQLASALNLTLTADPTNDSSLRAAAASLSDGIKCVWRRFEPNTAGAKVEEIRKVMINTRVRYDAYARYNQARSGAVISIPAGETCK